MEHVAIILHSPRDLSIIGDVVMIEMLAMASGHGAS